MKKPIKNFENLYEITDDGCIISIKTGKISRGYRTNKGYLSFDFRRQKGKCVSVHRLVAEAFIPNPENKPQVNHIDGDKTNNRVENLEWVTNGENQIHAFKNNLQKGNFEHPNSKLTLEQVLYIKNNCIVGSKIYGMQTLAKKFNVCNSTIKQIIQGKSYRYVNKTDNIGEI